VAANFFYHKLFNHHAVYNPAGIAHFIQHALAYLKSADGLFGAPQYAQDIKLLGRNVESIEHTLKTLVYPTVGERQVDHGFLPFVAKLAVADVLFKAHACKFPKRITQKN
jgi:hypothetical protein